MALYRLTLVTTYVEQEDLTAELQAENNEPSKKYKSAHPLFLAQQAHLTSADVSFSYSQLVTHGIHTLTSSAQATIWAIVFASALSSIAQLVGAEKGPEPELQHWDQYIITST